MTCAPSSTTGCQWSWGLKFARSGWGEEPVDLPRLKTLLAPYPSEEMTCWPVSTRVGNVKNNEPDRAYYLSMRRRHAPSATRKEIMRSALLLMFFVSWLSQVAPRGCLRKVGTHTRPICPEATRMCTSTAAETGAAVAVAVACSRQRVP
jgi:hypothetical protein